MMRVLASRWWLPIDPMVAFVLALAIGVSTFPTFVPWTSFVGFIAILIAFLREA